MLGAAKPLRLPRQHFPRNAAVATDQPSTPMSKGRKNVTSDRRDRLLGTYGYDRGAARRSVGPDLAEEDVWPTPAGHAQTEPDRSDVNRRQLGGLSLAFENVERRARHAAASVPVDVPDRPRAAHADATGSTDDDTEWVPPHEYLAREQGRRSTTTTSMLEGVGRTLKGRDMSRVRNAVWSQTGFFG